MSGAGISTTTTTDTGGQYSFMAANGTYVIEATHDLYASSGPQPVTVAGADVALPDLVLLRLPTVFISGTVGGLPPGTTALVTARSSSGTSVLPRGRVVSTAWKWPRTPTR